MRRLLILALAVVATACTLSHVSQDAAILLRGTVLDADGSPLAGARVVLVEQPDLGDAVFGFAFVVASLGTLCLADEAPAICGDARKATTGDDGSYSFQLAGRDTQGMAGTASTFYLSTALPDKGPSVSARFQLQREEVALPPLRIWAPRLELNVSRGTARAEWDSLAGSESERLVFFQESDSEAVWAVDGRGSVAVDARVLEDGRGAGAVEATSHEDGPGTAVRITHRSAQKPWVGTAGPAPSRSAACTPEPCTFTDGDLGPPETGGRPPAQQVSVDLATSRSVALVAVRGCPARCEVDTSVDGQEWRIVGTGEQPFFSVTPAAGPPVRFVRVRSNADLRRLAELSVW